jgi:SAM-dependent methyltransferase
MNDYLLHTTKDPAKARFINNDEFEGIEQVCSRAVMAVKYIRGEGIEIGALHKPLAIDNRVANVRYVDYKTLEENRKRYPELKNEEIVETTIIDDGFILSSLEPESVDFVIANHALEHSPDPYGTLEIWLNRLKQGGIIFVTVPIAEKCYDKGRPITSIEHLASDHEAFINLDKDAILQTTASHLKEFISISGANIREMNNMEPADPLLNDKLRFDLMQNLAAALEHADTYSDIVTAHITQINRVYDIHYHTFSPTSYENFITQFCMVNKATVVTVIKNGNGECIAIIRK